LSLFADGNQKKRKTEYSSIVTVETLDEGRNGDLRKGGLHRLRVADDSPVIVDKPPKAAGKRKRGAHSDPVVAADQRPQLQLSSFLHEQQSRISTPNPTQDFNTPSTYLKSTTPPQLHHQPTRTAKTIDYADDNGHAFSDLIDMNVRWTELYNDLLSYKDQHNGSTCVPLEVATLGPWVRIQRLRYSEGTLPNVNVSLLDSIGFVWNNAYEEKWIEMYEHLIAYKTKNNTILVPKRYKEDPQLGSWVRYQHQCCKYKDRIYLLNAIGFQWDGKKDNWVAMYERLIAYKNKHNSTLVPERCKEDRKLGLWVHHQRQLCKDECRILLLNSIGFRWDARTDSWMEMFQRLIAYKTEHNTTRVPRQFKKDPQLGLWVFTQRRCCKEKYCVGLLNNIDFEWDARTDSWNEMYCRLIAYKKIHNSTQVPQAYKVDLKLARWVHNQRQSCKDKDRVDLLNAVGFLWSSGRASSWMEMYQRLIEYKKEQKTAHVPQPYKGYLQLARWAYNQRRSCKEKGRIKMLDDIGFVWNSRKGPRLN
jgi:hypothetical protein